MYPHMNIHVHPRREGGSEGGYEIINPEYDMYRCVKLDRGNGSFIPVTCIAVLWLTTAVVNVKVQAT